ncbi:unnamed protein product [Arabidopsis thaliana]|uniref:Transmembrane protein n=2 Tax=Arabidopsis TaxID=3701 RepID=A0A654EF50_ARATH|nr:hypothetical protein ISN44_As01g033540 [Arabidopsis suecica]VYS47976.1 unnamed protein product [Arabidopsis thaliana]
MARLSSVMWVSSLCLATLEALVSSGDGSFLFLPREEEKEAEMKAEMWRRRRDHHHRKGKALRNGNFVCVIKEKSVTTLIGTKFGGALHGITGSIINGAFMTHGFRSWLMENQVKADEHVNRAMGRGLPSNVDSDGPTGYMLVLVVTRMTGPNDVYVYINIYKMMVMNVLLEWAEMIPLTEYSLLTPFFSFSSVQRKHFWQDQMKTCRLSLYGGAGLVVSLVWVVVSLTLMEKGASYAEKAKVHSLVCAICVEARSHILAGSPYGVFRELPQS